MVQPTSRDRLFAAQASFWSGETMGKYVDSGLALFSDYPILWVKRVAFPNFACAGWDCLASKGALAAALQVPGIAKPLVIVTTHLNARSAAGVPHSRSNYAFERQVDLLNRFLSTLEMQGEPMLLAGDFNVGSDPFRETSFSRLVADRGLWVVAAEHRCGDGCDRAIAPRLDHGLGLATGKSLVLYRRCASLWPSAMSVFGRARGGTMLSDHIGLMVQFRANARAPQHGPNVSGSV
jgi:endonuclease/exonuclease/phosphatase family metal-dependent hydrolase